VSSVFVSPSGTSSTPAGLEVGNGDPRHRSSVRDGEISLLPGEPFVAVPCSSTPVEESRLASAARTPAAFQSFPRCRLHDLLSLSGLNHTAHRLAVYASQPGSPPDHARLATDPLARLWPDGTFTRWTLHRISRWHRITFPFEPGFADARKPRKQKGGPPKGGRGRLEARQRGARAKREPSAGERPLQRASRLDDGMRSARAACCLP
jgi:hypothetical protein